MFGGGTSTEYEDIVNKTTDENLTSENWELILNLCDKVQEDGQAGAHAAIAAILKRLAHRNPNVQLYALSLTESLGKNLGIEIHRELASRAFTQGLEKLITDRNTHEKVRRRALGLIALWTAEFENDSSLGIMEDCYNNLEAKNYKFEQPQETPPRNVDDEIRRKEEEELQRVLEMSMQDRGGRSQWSEYSLTSGASSSGAGASGSGSGLGRSSTATAASPAASGSSTHPFAQPKYSGGGYVPARTPSPARVAAQQHQQQQQYHESLQTHKSQHHHHRHHASSESSATSTASTPTVAAAPASTAAAASSGGGSVSSMSASGTIVTRVRALHAFQPTEPGELAFEQGDIIKVVDRGYKDWWRGQLKGRTGIFPVNYVEAMPEPTAAELAKEAEQEASVFAQAVNVEKLLNMLRALDPAKDNLADNEEIQELYRSSMALRPKIVKLIDKYSQKRADLVSMNETFVRARTIFDRMMEESLARHTGIYDQPTYRPQYPQHRPDSRGPPATGRRPEYGPGPGPTPIVSPGVPPYGWGPNGYEQQPQPGGGYNVYPGPGPGPAAGAYPMGPSPQPISEVGMAAGSPYPTAVPVPGQPQQPHGYGPAAAAAYGGVAPQGPQQQQQQQPQIPGGYGVVPQGGYAGHQPDLPYSQQGPTPYPVQQQAQPQPQQPIQQQQPVQQQHQSQAQPIHQQPQPVQQAQPQQQQFEQQPQQQAHTQPEAIQVQPNPAVAASVLSPQLQPQARPRSEAQLQEAQPEPEAQPQTQPQPQPQPQQPISGPPPYPYHPSYTYADPNVQAWAQYYTQGGKDLAGSVYFVSIPGVTDGPGHAPSASSPQHQQSQEVNDAQQQQADQQSVSRQPSYQPQPQQQLEQQGLGRQQSYQAAAQPQPAQGAPESDLPYAALGPAASFTAASPGGGQHQQLHNMPRYQLHDQPVSQAPVQAQYATQHQQPADLVLKQASPSSPSSSTPSWVLPKKTTTGGAAALSPTSVQRDGPAGVAGGSYFPLSNQADGLDPVSGGGSGGQGPPHQGVGAPA